MDAYEKLGEKTDDVTPTASPEPDDSAKQLDFMKRFFPATFHSMMSFYVVRKDEYFIAAMEASDALTTSSSSDASDSGQSSKTPTLDHLVERQYKQEVKNLNWNKKVEKPKQAGSMRQTRGRGPRFIFDNTHGEGPISRPDALIRALPVQPPGREIYDEIGGSFHRLMREVDEEGKSCTAVLHSFDIVSSMRRMVTEIQEFYGKEKAQGRTAESVQEQIEVNKSLASILSRTTATGKNSAYNLNDAYRLVQLQKQKLLKNQNE